MTSRSVLSLVGVCWLGACSFPGYRFLPDDNGPVRNPLETVCTDGLPSDAETGIDCGGGCPRCGMGQTCRTHEDCESLACVNDTCQSPSCSDGVKNGAEADDDCGGTCDPCGPFSDCEANEDCADDVCAEGKCQPASCTDTVHNGAETDVDCGGPPVCGRCALGLACNQSSDCASNHCSGEICVSPQCTDGVLNGDESDLDCGGVACSPCVAGKTCKFDSDCVSTLCDAELECAAVSCSDLVLNGDESAVDCGGATCDGCPNLEVCDDGGDCASGACQSGLCVPAVATGAELPRTGWTATASNNYVDDEPIEVLDNVGNRWTSGTDMYDGMYFEVDMGELRTFFSATLVSHEFPLDVPPTYDVYLSVDGTYGAAAKSGLFGAEVSEVRFDTAQVARYIRWVVRAPSTNWWSMETINVYE